MAECFLCGEKWCDCEGDGWGIGTPEGEEETEWGIGPPGRCGRPPGVAGPCGGGTLRKWGIGPPGGDGAEKRGIGPPGGMEAWEGHRTPGDAVSMDTAAVENGEETHPHAHQHGGGGCQEGGPLCDGATLEVTNLICDMMLPESQMSGRDGEEEDLPRHWRTDAPAAVLETECGPGAGELGGATGDEDMGQGGGGVWSAPCVGKGGTTAGAMCGV